MLVAKYRYKRSGMLFIDTDNPDRRREIAISVKQLVGMGERQHLWI